MSDSGAYRLVGGKPATQHSFCALLDVLGFTQAVREAERQGKSAELLEKFSFLVRNWFTTLGDVFAIEWEQQRQREYRVFTDNVIVGGPLSAGSRADLQFTIEDLALLQLGLLAEGFFVRGGMSVGQLWIDDLVVYGGALIDAHEAEQRARSPRIVLHENAVSIVTHEVRLYFNTYRERRGHRFTDAILVDRDGKWFINYLARLFDRGMFDPDYAALDLHRSTVEAKLEQYTGDERIYPKYQWCASYHNYFCGTVPRGSEYLLSGNIPDLTIRPVEDVIIPEHPAA